MEWKDGEEVDPAIVDHELGLCLWVERKGGSAGGEGAESEAHRDEKISASYEEAQLRAKASSHGYDDHGGRE